MASLLGQLVLVTAFCAAFGNYSQETVSTTTHTTTTTTVTSEVVSFLEQRFATAISKSDSKESQLIGFNQEILEQHSEWFSQIIHQQEYRNYLMQIFDYKGARSVEAFNAYLVQNCKSKQYYRKFSLGLKHIFKNIKYKKQLVLPQYCQNRQSSVSQHSQTTTTTSTTTFQSTHAESYKTFIGFSQHTFGNVKSNSQNNQGLLGMCENFRQKDTLIKELIQDQLYGNYIKEQIRYYTLNKQDNPQEIYNYLVNEYFTKVQNVRVIAIIFRNIYMHMNHQISTLPSSKYINNYWSHGSQQQTRSSTSTSTTTSTNTFQSTHTQSYQTFIGFAKNTFGNIKSNSQNNQGLLGICENFRQKDTLIKDLIADQVYGKYIKEQIRYYTLNKQDNPQEIYNYLVNEYFTKVQNVRVIAIVFRNIYMHMNHQISTLPSSNYINNYWSQHTRTTTTTTTTTTYTTYTTFWEQNFGMVKSMSNDDNKLIQAWTRLRNEQSGCIQTILANHEYSEYLKKHLKYNGNDLYGYINQKYLNNPKKIRYLSVLFREIYVSITHKTALKVPKCVSSKKVEKKQKHEHYQKTAMQKTTIESFSSFWKQGFANFKSSSSSSAGNKKLVSQFGMFAQQQSQCLREIVTSEKYSKFISKQLGYKGHDLYGELVNKYFTSTVTIRKVAVIFKQIYLHSTHQIKNLDTPRYMKREEHIQKFVSFTKTNFAQITSHSEDNTQLLSVMENFRAQYGESIRVVLERKVYRQKIMEWINYKGQDNASEVYNYLVNNYFKSTQNVRVAAVIFKKIYRHISSNVELSIPSYIRSHKMTSTTVVQQQHHQQTQHQQQSQHQQQTQVHTQSHTEVHSQSQSMQTFISERMANLKSESNQFQQASVQVQEFVKTESYVNTIISNNEYSNYLAKMLGYGGDCHSSEFRSYLTQTAIREKPLAFALALKRISMKMSNNSYHLQVPRYIQNKFHITEYTEIVTTQTQTVSTVSSEQWHTA